MQIHFCSLDSINSILSIACNCPKESNESSLFFDQFILWIVSLERVIYSGNKHHFSPVMCPGSGTYRSGYWSSSGSKHHWWERNSLTPWGWNPFVLSVECSDSMPIQANHFFQEKKKNYSHSPPHQHCGSRVKKTPLLLCLTQCLQQMALAQTEKKMIRRDPGRGKQEVNEQIWESSRRGGFDLYAAGQQHVPVGGHLGSQWSAQTPEACLAFLNAYIDQEVWSVGHLWHGIFKVQHSITPEYKAQPAGGEIRLKTGCIL